MVTCSRFRAGGDNGSGQRPRIQCGFKARAGYRRFSSLEENSRRSIGPKNLKPKGLTLQWLVVGDAAETPTAAFNPPSSLSASIVGILCWQEVPTDGQTP